MGLGFFFEPVFRPRAVPAPDLRRFPRILWEATAILSSSWRSAGAEAVWPKKSSPSSFHRSCIGSCWVAFPPVDFACSLAESRLEPWREASCSSFNKSWTISLGLVTSVKFLLPTTMSWTCEQISLFQTEDLWRDWHLFWHVRVARYAHQWYLSWWAGKQWLDGFALSDVLGPLPVHRWMGSSHDRRKQRCLLQ